jgi:hypothetical protein
MQLWCYDDVYLSRSELSHSSRWPESRFSKKKGILRVPLGKAPFVVTCTPSAQYMLWCRVFEAMVAIFLVLGARMGGFAFIISAPNVSNGKPCSEGFKRESHGQCRQVFEVHKGRYLGFFATLQNLYRMSSLFAVWAPYSWRNSRTGVEPLPRYRWKSVNDKLSTRYNKRAHQRTWLWFAHFIHARVFVLKNNALFTSRLSHTRDFCFV